MYVNPNFPTKKALKEAVAARQVVTVFQPGPFGGRPIPNGRHSVEGPHHPEPHRWYASVLVLDGRVTQVVG